MKSEITLKQLEKDISIMKDIMNQIIRFGSIFGYIVLDKPALELIDRYSTDILEDEEFEMTSSDRDTVIGTRKILLEAINFQSTMSDELKDSMAETIYNLGEALFRGNDSSITEEEKNGLREKAKEMIKGYSTHEVSTIANFSQIFIRYFKHIGSRAEDLFSDPLDALMFKLILSLAL